jgi:hypothetical protein
MALPRQSHLEEDLATLADLLVSAGPLPIRHVRAVAPAIVRKWLIDGNLNLLARELGVSFELPTYDTSDVFRQLPTTKHINFFMAGGVLIGGVPIRWIYASSQPYTGNPDIPPEAPSVLLSPGKYLNSKRVFFEGQSFTTEQIVLFVANKCGGVHLDPSRDKPWHEPLERAAGYMTFGNPHGEKTPRLVELGEAGGPCMIIVPNERGNIWSCLEIELLCAAQSLLNVYCNGQRLIITGEA